MIEIMRQYETTEYFMIRTLKRIQPIQPMSKMKQLTKETNIVSFHIEHAARTN